MKAFIYSKQDNHLVEKYDGVYNVQYDNTQNLLYIMCNEGMIPISVKYTKVTIYQN